MTEGWLGRRTAASSSPNAFFRKRVRLSVVDKVPSRRMPGRASSGSASRRPARLRIHAGLRWLHIYISMFSLLVIFFFAVTGITLNHPEWGIVGREFSDEVSGEFPPGWETDGEADWLRLVEHLRAEHGVRGVLEDYRMDEFEGSLAFRGPGYAADVFFDPAAGSFELSVVRQGTVGVLNDLHRGASAGTAWSWLIDIAGVLLAALSITGLGLLLYLKKFRVSALVVMVAGTVLFLVLVALAT
jgi:uncharacterized protein